MSKENRSNKRNEDNRNRGQQNDNTSSRQQTGAPRTSETGAQNNGGQDDRTNISSNRSKEDKNARR